MTDSNQTERWVHEPGDRYVPVFGEWWMLNGGEPTLEYSQVSPPVGSWAQAFVDAPVTTALALLLLGWSLWAFGRDPGLVLRAMGLVPDQPEEGRVDG